MRLALLCVLALASWCISAVAVRDTESSISLGGKATESLSSSASRTLRYNGYGGGGYPYGNRGSSYGGAGYPNGRGGYPNSYGGYPSGYGGSGYPYGGGGYPNSYGGYPSGYGGSGYPYGGDYKQKQFGPGPTPGFGGGPYCRYGQATSLAPYGMSSANRCGAFSASTYPFINPLSYPGIGRKLAQYFYPGAGGPGGGITVVNSNPVSVSNPVNVFNPNRNLNVGFGGPGGILGLLGRRKQA